MPDDRLFQCPGCWSYYTSSAGRGNVECDCGERATLIDLRERTDSLTDDEPRRSLIDAVAVDAARGVAKRERWMVDYENEEGDPQHAVLSWLDDEATSLPEVGTYLVRESDARAVAVDAVAPPHFGVIDADDHAAGLRDPKVRETLDRVRAADVGGTDKPTVEELAEAVRSTPVPSVPAHRADASGSQTLLAAVAGDENTRILSDDSDAMNAAFHEHLTESVARGFARPRKADFRAGWHAALRSKAAAGA